MYFLDGEEKKRLLRGLLPRSRQTVISEELRGWNWHQPPLQPIYDIKLAIFDIASRYCSTSREVYLRRVENVKTRKNKAMIDGLVIHKTVSKFLTQAKKLIYQNGIENWKSVYKSLMNTDLTILDELKLEISGDDLKELERKAELIWNFEYVRIVSRVEEVLSRQPYIDEDSLVFHAIPVVVEQKLDGSFLGLSHKLSLDAFAVSTPVVFDIKYDIKRDFHPLGITGYAMVMEAVYEFPVDIGCIVYPSFKGDRIIVDRDFFIIDDEMRQNFVEERDERMRMVYEEIDPGVSENCYDTCPYIEECRGKK